jgi:hypothetical protein
MYNLNVSVTMLNKTSNEAVGASLFVPAPARDLYDVLLDVRNFPSWAPGVWHVEIVEGPIGPGMVSEWEIAVLGLRRKILSVLEEAEPPALLRWTYDGLVCGWGRCAIKDWGDGALAEFRTELHPAEPILKKLMRMPAGKRAACSHLKRSLTRLGQLVSGSDARVRVGPPERLG